MARSPVRPTALTRRLARGFTLLEVAIVFVVIALLASVALPGYQGSVRRGHRMEAHEAITRVLQAQEAWRGNAPTYAATLTELAQAATTSGSRYTLALTNATATGFTITATAADGSTQARDSGCTSIVATVANGNPSFTPTACWSR